MLRFVGRLAAFSFPSIMISVLLGSVECRAQSATAEALSPPVLPANTPVILRLTKSLYKNDAKPGQLVEFEVGYDVVVTGRVLVQRRAVVNGSVRQVDKTGKGPTKVLIDLGPAQTISGETVRLEWTRTTASDDAASVGAEALPFLPVLVVMSLFEKKVLLKQGELWNGVWVVAHVTENVALDPAKLKAAQAQLGESLRQGGLPESSVDGSGDVDRSVNFKAHLLHQAGDLDAAIEVKRQALAAKLESLGSSGYASALFSGDLHFDIAELFREKHDFVHAIPEYRAAVQLQPKNNSFRIGLVNALADSGDLDTALSEVKEAIRVVPEAPYFHYLLGRLLVKKNDPDAAIVELQWALKGYKNDLPPAHCELGRAWEMKGDLPAALREYHNALHPYGGDTECRAPYDRLRLQLKK